MPTVDELYKQAETFKRAKQYDEAIVVLNELLVQDPTHVLSHLALAVMCGKVGQHSAAVQHAEQAVELEPNEVFNHTALSVTYQRAFEATQDRQFIFKAEEAKAKAAQIQWQNK